VTHSSSRFTCWNQYSNRRFENKGTRIDYILISKDFSSSLKVRKDCALLRCCNDLSSEYNSEDAALHAATASGLFMGASFEGGGIAAATRDALHTQFGPRSTGIIYTPPSYSDHVAVSLLLDDDWDREYLMKVKLKQDDLATRKSQPHKSQQTICSYFNKAHKK
jgi:hypothetical protein